MSSAKKKQLSKAKQLQRQRQRRDERRDRVWGAPHLSSRLAEAESLIRDGDLPAANLRLAKLYREFPQSRELLETWCDLCYELEDKLQHAFVCEKLLALNPADAEVSLMLASLYLENGRPELATRQFNAFLRQFPHDVRADDIRLTLSGFAPFVDEIRAEIDPTPEFAATIMELHERTLMAIAWGDSAAAVGHAERLLALKPNFFPAYNNLAESQVQLGRLEAAAQTLRNCLALDPANAFAQGSLARLLVLLGQAEEARRQTARFQLGEKDSIDAYVRQAEAHLLVGEFQEVLDLWALWSRGPHDAEEGVRLLHYSAVAAARLRREDEARRLWKQALLANSSLSIVRDNLNDLKLPVGKRHGPWPSPLAQWVSQQSMSSVIDECLGSVDSKNASEPDFVFALSKQLPHLPKLVPILLDHGDQTGRELAIRVAKTLDTSNMRQALLEFALGERGPDDCRFETLLYLNEREAVPAGELHFWRDGERHAIRLQGFDIHREGINELGEAAQELHEQAYEELHKGNGRAAEMLLRAALELEESPSLYNNLAAALSLQRKTAEAMALLGEVHARFPDYFFGRIWKAKAFIQQRELDQAQAILDELTARQRLHVSEFAGLCEAQMEYAEARGDKTSIEAWLKMLENVEPDHQYAVRWRKRLSRGGLFERFRAMLPW